VTTKTRGKKSQTRRKIGALERWIASEQAAIEKMRKTLASSAGHPNRQVLAGEVGVRERALENLEHQLRDLKFLP